MTTKSTKSNSFQPFSKPGCFFLSWKTFHFKKVFKSHQFWIQTRSGLQIILPQTPHKHTTATPAFHQTPWIWILQSSWSLLINKGYVACMMKRSVAPRWGCLRKQTGPLMLVHELVPWWLLCYYFMHSLEERFCFVAAPWECALEQIFSSWVCFQLRLDSRDKKLLQEVSYKRTWDPKLRYVVSKTGTCYLLILISFVLTWLSKCNQQVGPPLFQRSCVPSHKGKSRFQQRQIEFKLVIRVNRRAGQPTRTNTLINWKKPTIKKNRIWRV